MVILIYAVAWAEMSGKLHCKIIKFAVQRRDLSELFSWPPVSIFKTRWTTGGRIVVDIYESTVENLKELDGIDEKSQESMLRFVVESLAPTRAQIFVVDHCWKLHVAL